jgi:hypothetical protein
MIFFIKLMIKINYFILFIISKLYTDFIKFIRFHNKQYAHFSLYYLV